MQIDMNVEEPKIDFKVGDDIVSVSAGDVLKEILTYQEKKIEFPELKERLGLSQCSDFAVQYALAQIAGKLPQIGAQLKKCKAAADLVSDILSRLPESPHERPSDSQRERKTIFSPPGNGSAPASVSI